ncbi:glutamate-5-semialdehyde dehydrogenase [Candidatus Omnitrophota bacterium]
MRSNIEQYIVKLAEGAKKASYELATLSTSQKNKAITLMAKALVRNKRFILKENKKDIRAAEAKGMSKALVDRLRLNDKRIKLMADSLREIVKLRDPVGETIDSWKRPNGLLISKTRTPIGVIAIIYEARPNVTSDCIGLCLKSSNTVILKGGSEALRSNMAIYRTLKAVAKKTNIPSGAISLIETTNRKAVDVLLRQDKHVHLVIPRGGEGLIQQVAKKSRIPVIKHYKGVCHIYVDKDVDVSMAQRVCFNAKVQRPSVCNAMEALLVHEDVAKKFLPAMIQQLQKAGVEIRGCSKTKKICGKSVKNATSKDWGTEYLDLILAVKVVGDFKTAVNHINQFGSGHSDAIMTKNKRTAKDFLKMVDSACVYSNASTRFTDGYEFGMGSEIGISTDKLHARGPMALEELTTYKYLVIGAGQIRQ